MIIRTRRPYLLVATLILLLAALFRLWELSATPPGLLLEELHNAQVADNMSVSDVAVVYDELNPGREIFYYLLLAASNRLLGSGLMLWRLPSVWLSLLALSVTFSLIRRLFNGRVALAAMGFMAVGFWPVWMGRAALNVTVMPLAIALFTYTILRALTASEPEASGMWFTLGGVGLGLAQYVHVVAWGLLPIWFGFVAYLALTHKKVIREQWVNIVYALALAAVLFIPMFIFVAGHSGIRAPVPLVDQPGWQADLGLRAARTLGGLFLLGDPSPARNLPLRPILEPLSGGLLVIGLGVTLARWRRASYALLPIWLAIGLIPALLVPQVPHFEYMVLIMPVVYALPALALDELRGLLREDWRILIAMLIVAMVSGNAFLTARDQFVLWPQRTEVRYVYQNELAMLARYVDRGSDDSPIGICAIPVEASELEEDPFAISDGELLDYFIHNRQVTLRKYDCRQSLVLAERGASQSIILLDTVDVSMLPGPLLSWMANSESLDVPGVRPDIVRRIDVEQELAALLSRPADEFPAEFPPEASGGPGLVQFPIVFTDNMLLEGYHLRDASLLPGEPIEVTTFWRLTGPAPGDLLLFADLQGGPGVAAESAAWGVDLSSLQPGDIIVQYSLLQSDSGEPLESGGYRLVVSLIVPDIDYRLLILDQNVPRSERILLQDVFIIE